MTIAHALHRPIVALACAAACALATAQPIDVQVDKRGDLVVVDVQASAPIDPHIAWAVLTDYEHMARYVSAVKSSSARHTGPHTLEVDQVVETRVAFMDIKVSSVRTVELTPPREVRSKLLRGDFKRYEFVTRIEPRPGGGTLITHHGEYVPTSWLPPMIGPAVIRQQTEQQYRELIAEMQRRAGGSTDAYPSMGAAEAATQRAPLRRDDTARGR
jgi:hypothetical protein